MATTTKEMPVKPPPLKLPKTAAACADLYYQTRLERLAADKVAAALKERETFIANHLIDTLPKSDATGVAGKVARVFVEVKKDWVVKDWDAVWGYIFKAKNPALLQRRLSPEAVNELMLSKKPVPGVEANSYAVLRFSKL